MKVVVVNAALAYPPTAGNWLRTLKLLLPLAGRHEITYLCRGVRDQEAAERARAFYASHGIRAIITSDHAPDGRGPRFYARLAANLLSPLPYSIAAHRSPEVIREMHRLAREEHIDLFQVDTLAYADAMADEPDARTLVIAHNMESLIWQRYWETERQPLKRLYIREQWRKYQRFEGRALRDATKVVAVTDEDAALIRDTFGVRDPAVVDNGVDVAYFADTAAARAPEARELLFLGSLDWRPNLDGIDVLLDRVMPLVLAQEPEARLTIVGRNPSAALARRIGELPYARLHADVPDVRPYLTRATALAVPLRIGGGSRLKILEATAAGVPVVSTRVGAEGLRFTAGRDLAIADTPEEMAAALVDTIRRPADAAARAKNARAVIESFYDWSRLAARLEDVWYEVAGTRRLAPA